MLCDSCVFYTWDEDDEEYYCEADIDEDDYAQLMQAEGRRNRGCPYWQADDEYAVVAHQAF